MNSSTKRKKTKERDNKNNDCNQTWLPQAIPVLDWSISKNLLL
jgi:hypothetical protein